MKKSQDGKALILRLVEVEGRETQAKLSLAPGLLSGGVRGGVSAVEVDTLERPLEGRDVRLKGDALLVKVPAFGMSTVCIRSG